MSYELIELQNVRGTYTNSRIFSKEIGLLANDAAFLNIVVFVSQFIGGIGASGAVLMEESYDGGKSWKSIVVAPGTISTTGEFKFSPQSSDLLSPLVRFKIVPLMGAEITIDRVVHTRILSGVAVKSSSGGLPPATEATLADVLTEVTEISDIVTTVDYGLTTDAQRVSAMLGIGIEAVSATNPVPTSIASLPLPTGASTEDKQDTEIAVLLDIETNTDSSLGRLVSIETIVDAFNDKTAPLGQALEAASSPVVLPQAQIDALTPQIDALTDVQLRATPIDVEVVSSALPTGAATEAEQDVQSALLSSIDLSNASILTASGNIATDIDELNAKTPSLGQQLAAASSPVVLTQIQIDTLTPQTDALTDAQLRATAIDVSISAIPLAPDAATETAQATQIGILQDIETHTENSAISLNTIATQVPNLSTLVEQQAQTTLLETIELQTSEADTTQTLTTITSSGNKLLIVTPGHSTVSVQVTGTFSGTIQIQGSIDGTNYVNINMRAVDTGVVTTGITTTGLYKGAIGGFTNIRIFSPTFTSGTAIVSSKLSKKTTQVDVPGIATSNLQTSGNTSLSTLVTRTPDLNDASGSGTFNVSGQTFDFSAANFGSFILQVFSSSFAGSVTIRGTADGVNFKDLPIKSLDSMLDTSNIINTDNGIFQGLCAGLLTVRLTVFISSGTLDYRVIRSSRTPPSAISARNSSGANKIGSVDLLVGINGGSAATGVGASNSETQRVQLANESLPNNGLAAVQLTSASFKPFILFADTTNVTTSFMTIVVSAPVIINKIEVYNGTAEPLYIATGNIALEVVQLIVPPGGTTGFVSLRIVAGVRVSMRAATNIITSGTIIVNMLG